MELCREQGPGYFQTMKDNKFTSEPSPIKAPVFTLEYFKQSLATQREQCAPLSQTEVEPALVKADRSNPRGEENPRGILDGSGL